MTATTPGGSCEALDLTELVVRTTAPAGPGHLVNSAYVEVYWLPILAPTAMWLLRRLALIGTPAGVVVNTDRLAEVIGIRRRLLLRATDRLIRFGAAEMREDGALEVRLILPDVPDRLAESHLPPSLRAMLGQEPTCPVSGGLA